MATTTNRAKPRQSPSPAALNTSPEARRRMIGDAAYYRYVHRGYAPGHDLDDWLAAEADFERALRRQPARAEEPLEETGMAHGGGRSPAEDDAMKRVLKAHPRREIPRYESMDPEEAPPRE